MSRTIPRNVEGPDWRVWPEEIRCQGWAKLFGRAPDAPLPLNVDIGFGDGEFLIATASRDPEGVYVGVELSFKRVLKVARRLANSEIRNIRLVGIDAYWVITEGFTDESVARAWINFPDPWPRRRHHRRRIVEPRLIQSLSRRLAVGGRLTVATDDTEYAKVIQPVLEDELLLDNVCAPAPHRSESPGRVQTTFQRDWASQGRTSLFFEYRRRAVARSAWPKVAGASAHG
jgi:tRNA (guanine-N7-)-methyltransferase